MHQDTRGYFYRTFRDGSAVRRQYLGQSHFARKLWEFQKFREQADTENRQAMQAVFADGLLLEEQVKQFSGEVELWRRFVLLENGFRQHKRGEWRRQRGLLMNDELEKSDLNEERKALRTRGTLQRFRG